MFTTMRRAGLISSRSSLAPLLLLLLIGEVLAASPSDVWQARRARASQYHRQDPLSGTYQYGYAGPHHAKSESNVDGVTRGGYSYIDANGLTQTVSYTADSENGFRVQASNLPDAQSAAEDAPDVALARKSHGDLLRRLEAPSYQVQSRQYQRSPYLLSPEEARGVPSAPRPGNALLENDDNVEQRVDPVAAPRRFSVSSSSTHHLLRPAALLPAPMYAVPLPLVHSSMHHAQDSLGQYEYSYTGDTSAKTESRTLDGTTRGAYSYIDANGLLQQVHYIADRDGFRVLATNLPEA